MFENEIEKFKKIFEQKDIINQLNGKKEIIRKYIGNKFNELNNFDKEKKAVGIASLTSLGLAIFKLVIGGISGSMSIISSAIDSFLDCFMSLFNVFLMKNAEKESDDIHNYGYGKLEGLGAFVEGILILFSSILLIYFSILKFFDPQPINNIRLLIIVMFISGIIVIGLLIYLKKIGKESNSGIIKIEITNYTNNALSTFGITLSLIIINYSQWYWIDPLISIIIAFYIMYASSKIIKSGFDMLMDKSLNIKEIDEIKGIIMQTDISILSIESIKSRQSGNLKFIETEIKFSNNISFEKLYEICLKIKNNIKNEFENIYINIYPVPN